MLIRLDAANLLFPFNLSNGPNARIYPIHGMRRNKSDFFSVLSSMAPTLQNLEQSHGEKRRHIHLNVTRNTRAYISSEYLSIRRCRLCRSSSTVYCVYYKNIMTFLKWSSVKEIGKLQKCESKKRMREKNHLCWLLFGTVRSVNEPIVTVESLRCFASIHNWNIFVFSRSGRISPLR